MTEGMAAAETIPPHGLPPLAAEAGGRRRFSPSIAWGLTGLGGMLLALAYAQEPFWWAAWLAPGALIAAALLAERRARKWLAFAAGLIGGATSLGYYATVSDSWAIAIALVAGRALLWTWMLVAAARAAERLPPAAAVFALPLFLAAAETLIAWLSPHGEAGSYAYSQMDALAVVQIASVAGSAGVVATVALGGSALGLVIARSLGWRGRGGVAAPVALAAIGVSAVIAFGLLRLSGAPAHADGPEVALMAQDSLGGEPGDLELLWRVYRPAIDRAVRPGRIVVLPEALRILDKAAADEAAGELARLAQAGGATIVAGFIVDDGEIRRNRAVIASPGGTIAWYDKQHLVPGFEDAISPGGVPLLIDVDGVRAGVAICKDMHFASLGRDYADRGARLMLVPANDFTVDAWMASRMTALRGVENGYAIARTARNGRMTVSDRYGRILSEQASAPQVTTLVARLPAPADQTASIFSRWGAWGDWLWIGAAALLLWQLRRARRMIPSAEKVRDARPRRPQTVEKANEAVSL